MSNELLSKTCEPCRGGIPPLTKAEAKGYLQQLSGCALVDDGRIDETTAGVRYAGTAQSDVNTIAVGLRYKFAP